MQSHSNLLSHEFKCFTGYSKQAHYYDKERFEDFKGWFRKELVYRILDEWIKPSKNSLILDVATGTGVGALYLAATKKESNVYGIDITENMLEEARQKARVANINNVYFERANARELPYESNTFDAIVSLRFFHHIPNEYRRLYIEEMKRVLKPGGIMVLEFKNLLYGGVAGFIKHYIMKNPGGHYLWPHQILNLFRGLKIKKIIGLYLPLVQKLARRNKKLAFGILKIAKYFPFNFLSSDLYIICAKESL